MWLLFRTSSPVLRAQQRHPRSSGCIAPGVPLPPAPPRQLSRPSVCPTPQDCAQVHEAEQSPRLQGQGGVRGAAHHQRAEDGAAAAAEHPAGDALPPQPVPGPGDATAPHPGVLLGCSFCSFCSFCSAVAGGKASLRGHLVQCLAVAKGEGEVVCGNFASLGVSSAVPQPGFCLARPGRGRASPASRPSVAPCSPRSAFSVNRG